MNNLTLITPSKQFRQSYLNYISELGNEERYPFPLDFDHSNFSEMLQRNHDFANGVNLPNGYVASSTYWMIENNDIIGVSNLRHYLNDEITFVGGHIGLGIRPSRRGEGLSKRLLMLTLEQAKIKNIADIHIHCYQDNHASSAMITACGGVLHSVVELADKDLQNKTKIARYLIKNL